MRIHCEFPDESGPPSMVLGALRQGKLVRETRPFRIRPSERGGYDGDLEFGTVDSPGKYALLVQCMDYVKTSGAPQPSVVITCEVSVPLEVSRK